MTETDQSTQQDSQARNAGRGTDDRRGEVRPGDNPVPSSPAPEEDAVREAEEKLARVKPY